MMDVPFKIALFNDTSVSGHFGCDAVLASIRTLANKFGGEIIYSHPLGMAWENDRAALNAIQTADVVLVNAEGSIHHSSRRAVSLAALGPHCRANDTPCYLINGTLQGNGADVVRSLGEFSGIWVRESRSQAELQRFGLDAQRCPDLSLYHEFSRCEPNAGANLVIDSVLLVETKRLFLTAVQTGSRFVTMKKVKGFCVEYKGASWLPGDLGWKLARRVPLKDVSSYAQFAGLIRSHESVITGRFHGFCMALLVRAPMAVVRSNTWKTEAMVEDIGLSRERVRDMDFDQVPAFSEEEVERVESYLRDARARMEALFRRILNRGAGGA